MLAVQGVFKVWRITYLDAPDEDHLHTPSQPLYNTLQYVMRRVHQHAHPANGTDLHWYPRSCI
jgi:hypothetical protein